jgi:hypothetical protein
MSRTAARYILVLWRQIGASTRERAQIEFRSGLIRNRPDEL